MKTRLLLLDRLKKESEATKSYKKMADRVGVNFVTLWRVVNDKSPGDINFWDKVFEYYGK